MPDLDKDHLSPHRGVVRRPRTAHDRAAPSDRARAGLAKDHPTSRRSIAAPTRSIARISLSTVYRTLKLFSEKGILERHDFGHKRGRYEEATGPTTTT